MAKEMTDQDIQEGGEFYEARLFLEQVAQDLGVVHFEVRPVDRQRGPACYLTRICPIKKVEIKASLWEDDSGMLKIFLEPANGKYVLFYQDEAGDYIWDQLTR